MDILIIAPEIEGLPQLDTWQEVDVIGDLDGVRAEILAGKNVTRARVAARLKEQYDVVLFAGHGEPGKFAVSDGCLTSVWLARYVRNAQPRVVLLSACNSAGRSASTLASLAEEIAGAGIAVIAMPLSVNDNAAIVYDVEFMRAMAAGASVREAHRIALEQMEQLAEVATMPLYLPGANGQITTGLNGIADQLQSMDGRLAVVEEQVGNHYTEMTRTVSRILDVQLDNTKRLGRVEDACTELRQRSG